MDPILVSIFANFKSKFCCKFLIFPPVSSVVSCWSVCCLMMISLAALITFFPTSSTLDESLLQTESAIFQSYSPHTANGLGCFVREDGDTLGGEDLVEEQYLRAAHLGQDPCERLAPVELSQHRAGGQGREHRRHVGQEVEGIPQQHRLQCGDGLHLRPVREDLGLVPDEPRVADRQAVEEVHQDDHDQEHEGQEVHVGQRSKATVEVNWNVTELRSKVSLVTEPI